MLNLYITTSKSSIYFLSLFLFYCLNNHFFINSFLYRLVFFLSHSIISLHRIPVISWILAFPSTFSQILSLSLTSWLPSYLSSSPPSLGVYFFHFSLHTYYYLFFFSPPDFLAICQHAPHQPVKFYISSLIVLPKLFLSYSPDLSCYFISLSKHLSHMSTFSFAVPTIIPQISFFCPF